MVEERHKVSERPFIFHLLLQQKSENEDGELIWANKETSPDLVQFFYIFGNLGLFFPFTISFEATCFTAMKLSYIYLLMLYIFLSFSFVESITVF